MVERFVNEFNIAKINESYKKVRNCFGHRQTEEERMMNLLEEEKVNSNNNQKFEFL